MPRRRQGASSAPGLRPRYRPECDGPWQSASAGCSLFQAGGWEVDGEVVDRLHQYAVRLLLLLGLADQPKQVEHSEAGVDQLRRLHPQSVMPDAVGAELAVAQAMVEADQRVSQIEQRGFLVGKTRVSLAVPGRLAQLQLCMTPGR